MLASLAIPGGAADAARSGASTRGLTGHAPIDIEGNAGFNATNGVMSGTGSATDPYVISGWSIATAGSMGVQIRNTVAHAVLRDLQVTGATVAALYFYNVANVTLANVTASLNPGDGFRFESSRDVAVGGSDATENANGLVLLNTVRAVVRGTNFTANTGDGVLLTGSPNATLQGNRVAYNGFGGGHGIELSFTTGDAIRGNAFTGNGVFLDGDALGYFDSHAITSDNLVGGLPILYEKGQNGLGLSGMQVGQVLLAGCLHTHLSNLTATGADVGIQVAFGNNVTVGPGVTVSDTAVGVQVLQSPGFRLLGSALLDTATGVLVLSSGNAAILNTKISAPFATSGPYDGVVIRNSGLANVSGNLIRHHRNAIAVSNSGNATLMDNVAQFSVVGLNVSSSAHLRAAGNLIVQDSAGIRLQNVTNSTFSGNAVLGILGTGANVSGSSSLRFVHNTFGGARTNAYDAWGPSDRWNASYPTGGNFWADYHGVDQCHGSLQNDCTGGDGIGDTPYPFAVNAEDRYPLMVPPVNASLPPEAILVVAPLEGTVLTPFEATANLSSDFKDSLASLQVRWSWDDGLSWTPWSTAKFVSHRFATVGAHTVDLEVRNRAGLTDNATERVILVPKPDTVPPAILFSPPASANVYMPIPLVANLSDLSGIANATVLFQGVDGGPFLPLSMRIESGGENFTATVPAQSHAGTVAVVLFANDTWANEARAPLVGASTIRIVDTQTPILIGFALAASLIAAVAVVFFLLRRKRKRPAVPPAAPAEPARPPEKP
ncbi:MAG TPA: NosD domain-containing protein [Thermoplasmata archaeon]|nr:NosD domain-containing protein [Thermoplasmata archaeon]